MALEDVPNDQEPLIQEIEARVHRPTIFAQPLDLSTDFVPPYYDKTDQQRSFLDKVVRETVIFMDLVDEERNQLIDAMQAQTVPKDTVIIQQGDVGDFFYIVESGRVDFVDQGTTVGRCSKGGSFGELALLYHCPRAVSCIAQDTTVHLWKVDQFTFRHLLARRAQRQDHAIHETIRQIALFRDLDEAALTRFIAALTPVNWKKGDKIVRKGEEGRVFYIILHGEVKIHDIGLGDSQMDDVIFGPGYWFGERALLTGEPRAANVTALEDVATLAMDRPTFEATVGPLQAYMEREMRKRFLKTIPFLSRIEITDAEFDQLAILMQEVCYAKGTKLAEAGKPYTRNLWILRHGELLVVQENTDQLFELRSGDYFGDKSVGGSHDHISSHTATCEEELTAWVLTRENLDSVLGNRLAHEVVEPCNDLQRSVRTKSVRLHDLEKHRILGTGAFGKVWLVSKKGDPSTAFALKTISKRQLLDTRQEKGVVREKEFLESLHHPFILHLVSSFQDEVLLYLLLPLIPGGELFSVLQRNKDRKLLRGLPETWAGFYSGCILEALSHFTQRKVAYRDLKLENVLIDADGYCIVVDLGFAKVVTDKTFTLVGTPEYLAPEIILSKGHNYAADYWALGILIYELMAGKTPFYSRGSSQVDMFKRIVLMKYSFPPFMSDEAKDIVEKLLQRNPSKRLGNLSNGPIDVKTHPFYNATGVSFSDLLDKKATAPWVPETADPLSASMQNYDDFSMAEKEVNHDRRLSPQEQEMFQNF